MSKYNDLTGQKFGRLTAIEPIRKSGRILWVCECECGNTKQILAINLTRGFTKSCGCLHNEELSKNRLINLDGKRFGRLVVLERTPGNKKDVYWTCLCDCGNIKSISGSRLRQGKTKSCGCLKFQYNVKSEVQYNHHKTHGMSNTRIYAIYRKMLRRCYNKNCKEYYRYGGRGISVCDEWQGENGFIVFYEWACDNGYTDILSIDRINNDGNYEPSNCRWVDAKTQANNTKSTIFLTYNGETKPASEWAVVTGISQDTLTQRKRSGWSDEDCVTVPLNVRRNRRN